MLDFFTLAFSWKVEFHEILFKIINNAAEFPSSFNSKCDIYMQ